MTVPIADRKTRELVEAEHKLAAQSEALTRRIETLQAKHSRIERVRNEIKAKLSTKSDYRAIGRLPDGSARRDI